MRSICGIFVIVLVLILFSSNMQFSQVGAYHKDGHYVVIEKALEILSSDGYNKALNFFDDYLSELKSGSDDADHEFEDKTINGNKIGVNSCSHFYNPTTGNGYTMQTTFLKNYMVNQGIAEELNWKTSTLLGPHLPSTEMANICYARAVDEFRNANKSTEESGNYKKHMKLSMIWLGKTLHMIQDATVPHHVSDAVGEETRHGDYEKRVFGEDYKEDITHATSGGIYNDNWLPEIFVKYASSFARKHLAQAMIDDQMYRSYQSMIPLAERLCAGLLHRFYEKCSSENFSVVVLKITGIRDKTNGKLEVKPDYYSKVSINNKSFMTSYLEDCSTNENIEPQKYYPYTWMFSSWVTSNKSGMLPSVPITVELWDYDLAPVDQQCDLVEKANDKTININFNLYEFKISGDYSSIILPTPILIPTNTKILDYEGKETNTQTYIRFSAERVPPPKPIIIKKP